ncbi:MAG: hypothetical protein B6A08_11100 [Sorangiineae bacterium NIC37A_2]|nr:MAG: hypothetical protein B6A08_11100 [Sorangiineae bacterium NIC37A_2]
MFGISMSELAVIGVVALIFVGPQKLPGLLRTAGEWVGKLRRLTTEVRAQTGIDEILREEGIDGVRELRALLRGEVGNRNWQGKSPSYEAGAEPQETDEYPVEGADIGDALPDDLWFPEEPDAAPQAGPDGVSETAAAVSPEPTAPSAETPSGAQESSPEGTPPFKPPAP